MLKSVLFKCTATNYTYSIYTYTYRITCILHTSIQTRQCHFVYFFVLLVVRISIYNIHRLNVCVYATLYIYVYNNYSLMRWVYYLRIFCWFKNFTNETLTVVVINVWVFCLLANTKIGLISLSDKLKCARIYCENSQTRLIRLNHPSEGIWFRTNCLALFSQFFLLQNMLFFLILLRNSGK